MSDQWIPHHPETWPWRYGKLKKAVTMSEYQGHWDTKGPVMKQHEAPAGTIVKIVMVSRFGDVGITDHLDRETGYGTRVEFDDLEQVEAP